MDDGQIREQLHFLQFEMQQKVLDHNPLGHLGGWVIYFALQRRLRAAGGLIDRELEKRTKT